MKKTHFALLGIICVLMVATTSLQVAYAWTPPSMSFPPCTKVPSYYLKGTWILPQDMNVPRKDFSYVRFDMPGSSWSNMPEAYKKQFLSYGTRVDLYVNAQKEFLLMDICYDATTDTLYKFSYMQYFPYQWKAGSYSFHFVYLYNGAPVYTGDFTITFT